VSTAPSAGPSGPPRATVDLWVALGVIAATVAGCTRIRFEDGTVVDGISWFGVHRETVPLFAVGMLTTAGLQVHAARSLAAVPPLDTARQFLIASALLMVGILVTPYSLRRWLEVTHDSLGACLFALQLLFAAWYWSHHRSRVTTSLLVAQFVAGLFALAGLLRLQHDLFLPQVAYQLAFATHLPLSVAGLARSTPSGDALRTPESA